MSASMNNTCDICCDKYTKTKRSKITCPNCNFESCKQCVRMHMLTEEGDPHCMNCKKEITKTWMNEYLPKSFIVKDYRNHRENVLFERAVSLIPSVMEAFEIFKEYQIANDQCKLMKKKIAAIREDIKTNHKTLTKGKRPRLIVKKGHKKIYEEKTANMIKFKRLLTLNTRMKNDLNNELYNNLKIVKKTGKIEHTVKCPGEDCAGVLNNKSVCPVCENAFCKDCNALKEKGHICDQDDVETFQIIKNTTVPCPSCNCRVSKIEGCNQMFCTACNTPFNWITGKKITTEFFHNPHYFDYLNKGGIALGNREANNGEAVDNCTDVQHDHIPLKLRGDLALHVLRRKNEFIEYGQTIDFSDERRFIVFKYVRKTISKKEMMRLLWLEERKMEEKVSRMDMYTVVSDAMNMILVEYINTNHSSRITMHTNLLKKYNDMKVMISNIDKMHTKKFKQDFNIDMIMTRDIMISRIPTGGYHHHYV